MTTLKAGDLISVSYKEKRKVITKDLTVVAADEKKSFILVTNGLYRDTIDRWMVEAGKVIIQVIQGGSNCDINKAINTLNPVQI